MGKFRKEVSAAAKVRNPKNKRNKTTIVFDQKIRNDWLTGFSRRKNERRKRAQHEEVERLKEEKRQLKKQKREERAKELEDMREAVGATFATEIDDTAVAEPKVYDLPEHTVTVVDVLDANFAGKSGLRLGFNEDEEEGAEEKQEPGEGVANGEQSEKAVSGNKRITKKKIIKKKGKSHKNLTHLMDKHKKKKKDQIPNKWQRQRRKK